MPELFECYKIRFALPNGWQGNTSQLALFRFLDTIQDAIHQFFVFLFGTQGTNFANGFLLYIRIVLFFLYHLWPNGTNSVEHQLARQFTGTSDKDTAFSKTLLAILINKSIGFVLNNVTSIFHNGTYSMSNI